MKLPEILTIVIPITTSKVMLIKVNSMLTTITNKHLSNSTTFAKNKNSLTKSKSAETVINSRITTL